MRVPAIPAATSTAGIPPPATAQPVDVVVRRAIRLPTPVAAAK